jgi:hypothetical protein
VASLPGSRAGLLLTFKFNFNLVIIGRWALTKRLCEAGAYQGVLVFALVFQLGIFVFAFGI